MPHDLPPLDVSIEPEKPEDQPAVDALIAESFGPEREKRTVYRFRDGRPPLGDLAFVARLKEATTGAEKLVASLNFWAVAGPEGPLPLLGPLAVLPALRGRGVGRALVAHGLSETKRLGWPAVLIVGDPGYYAPFGFSVGPVAGLELPGPVGPLTFMGLEFEVGALTGLVGSVRPAPRIDPPID
ncbi:MAG: N-acetyltransferase [Marivibrio sp.]|uniref:GNAT family N-acetyltransferase n=1 Tax=Marivibrio sp. TaxID=2039719 RepID=UPI0032EBEC44